MPADRERRPSGMVGDAHIWLCSPNETKSMANRRIELFVYEMCALAECVQMCNGIVLLTYPTRGQDEKEIFPFSSETVMHFKWSTNMDVGCVY